MTGPIEALTDTTVTVGGVRYACGANVRELLKLFRELGYAVDLFVVSGSVRYVSLKVPDVR